MRDLIVTTPKHAAETAAREAQQCIEAGGGYYFRTFTNHPRDLGVGSKVFYVEDGFVRGYAVVLRVARDYIRCGTTGELWYGHQALMPADSWKWIKPIPMKGFQGFRYFSLKFRVVGGWLDPKPVPELHREGA